MKILVVGGAGYLGGAITDYLRQTGHDFMVCDILLYEDQYRKKVPFVLGDIRNNEKLYMWRLMRKVYQHFPLGCRVLDVGCGEGLPAEILAQRGCQVTAVDIEPQTKEWAKRGSLGIKFKQASAEKLPFANGCFDAV